MVQQTLKDPYLFDFLTLEVPFHERELETGLMAHLQKFLLELGQGFAFVGRQYRVELGEQDFYIDLLFYHLKATLLRGDRPQVRCVQARVRGQDELLLQRGQRPAAPW